MAKFDKWDHRFIEMVNLVAQWSSCFQENRKIGAVIVKNKRVLTTGYNGAPANTLSCVEKGECLRRKLNIPLARATSCVMPYTQSKTLSFRLLKRALPLRASTLASYAPALCHLFQDDCERRHCKGCVSASLS